MVLPFMQKTRAYLIVGLLVLMAAALVCPLVSAEAGHSAPYISANPGTIVRDGDGTADLFRIYYSSERGSSSLFDIYINNGDVSGIVPPEIDTYGFPMDNTPAMIGPGHWQFWTKRTGARDIVFTTSTATTPGEYVFKVTDPSGNIPDLSTTVTVLDTPTPTPTPAYGTLIIESDPEAATVYVDSEIKGITPLTISNVENGNYKVLVRLDGYEDMKDNSVHVRGDTQTLDFTLPLEGAPTTEPTQDLQGKIALLEANVSQQNESIVAIETSVGDLNSTVATQRIIVAEHIAVTTSPTINYSATLAAIQTHQAEQAAQIDWLTSAINAIKAFLGLT